MKRFGDLKSEMTTCKWKISSTVSGYTEGVFYSYSWHLTDENKMCSRDANIFNPDISYVT